MTIIYTRTKTRTTTLSRDFCKLQRDVEEKYFINNRLIHETEDFYRFFFKEICSPPPFFSFIRPHISKGLIIGEGKSTNVGYQTCIMNYQVNLIFSDVPLKRYIPSRRVGTRRLLLLISRVRYDPQTHTERLTNVTWHARVINIYIYIYFDHWFYTVQLRTPLVRHVEFIRIEGTKYTNFSIISTHTYIYIYYNSA